MSITNGQNADASDFVSTSAGAGDSGKVAKLNASGKHDVSFMGFDGCRAIQNATSALGNASMSVMTFQDEQFDTNSFHSNSVNPSRITIPVTGKYKVGATIQLSAAGNADMCIRLNGTTDIAFGGRGSLSISPRGMSCETIYQFTAGDYIEVYGGFNGSANSSGDEGTHFWAYRIG